MAKSLEDITKSWDLYKKVHHDVLQHIHWCIWMGSCWQESLKSARLEIPHPVWLHISETARHSSLNTGWLCLCPSTPTNTSSALKHTSSWLPGSLLLKTIWSLESVIQAQKLWAILTLSSSSPLANQTLCFNDLSFGESLQALFLLYLSPKSGSRNGDDKTGVLRTLALVHAFHHRHSWSSFQILCLEMWWVKNETEPCPGGLTFQ